MSNGITKESVLRVFPEVLQRNADISSLGDVFADYLSAAVEDAKRCAIYPNIDTLDGDALDILAYDFKIDWWDANLDLEKKREVFKRSFYVHKHLGTKRSVQTAVSAVYQASDVTEWFEYGGEPYFFKLRVNITEEDGISAEKHQQLIDNVNFYKSARSVLEEIEYYILWGDRDSLRIYAGVGIQMAKSAHIGCEEPTFDSLLFLVDENGDQLADEDGAWLAEFDESVPIEDDTEDDL